MSAETNGVKPDDNRLIVIPAGSVDLEGELSVPPAPHGVVIFAHGISGCRQNVHLHSVAGHLHRAGLGTLVFDLLTPGEDATEFVGRHLRYNMGLLTQRLICAAHWLAGEDEARHLRLGFLGFKTGGGAALVAAADLPEVIGAVVVQSGRVDLAGGALRRVKCPTLLLVDQQDEELAELNQETNELLTCEKTLALLRSPDEALRLAAEWFAEHLSGFARSRLRVHDWDRP
jgi:putative phosphoribosyl transferase